MKVQVTVMIYAQELFSHGDLYLELEELWDNIIQYIKLKIDFFHVV